MSKTTGYELSRKWFDFCFENPEKIKPNHTAMYFFAIEHCNRLGWKQKFGFPSTMVMEAIGVKSYNTYINTLKDLVDFGFIKMIERSKNQYSSNIIALSNFNKANDKALDKALIKHVTKQSESTVQSIDSIDKQRTINKEQLTKNNIPAYSDFKNFALIKKSTIDELSLKLKYESWTENGWKDGNNKPIKNWKSKLLNTIPYLKEKSNGQKNYVDTDQKQTSDYDYDNDKFLPPLNPSK